MGCETPDKEQGMAATTIAGVLERADEIIIEHMNNEGIPGLGIGIVQGSELVYARGFGPANAEENRPITPDTVFRIGSISKTMTAIGLMQLWERDKFGLDDPVNDHLKAIRVAHPAPDAPPITFRHLLTHTAGIGELRMLSDIVRPMAALGVKEGQSIPTPNEMYAAGLHAEVHAGAKWAYANHAFAVLAQAVEDVSGEPFAEYMIRQVFEPLGMHHTDYRLSDRVRDQLAVGYARAGNRVKAVPYMEITVSGAGSVFSTVNDMGRYMAALMNGGSNAHGTVLQPETLALMFQPHYQLDPHLPALGLAFWVEQWDGHRVVNHDGGWIGFISSMWFTPDDRIGVVTFTNGMVGAKYPLIAPDLLRRLLDVPDPAAQGPRPGILENPHLWGELTGFYGVPKGLNTNFRLWGAYGGEFEVFVRDGRLALRTLFGPLRKGFPLYPNDPDNPLVFRLAHDMGEVPSFPQVVVFQRNAAGQVDRLATSFNTFHKRPLPQSVRFRALAGLGALAGGLLGALAFARLRPRK
jgi:CubicO group peptidase (beta-lactamase class C family)